MTTHILRDRILTGDATISSTATPLDLYPLENVFNSRPSVPFRTEDETVQIDIDLGASFYFDVAGFVGMNLHDISPFNRLVLRAGNTFPPSTLVTSASPWAGSAPYSDYLAYFSNWAVIPVIAFFIFNTYRYFRFELDQTERLTDFTEIGEIYFTNFQSGSSSDWWFQKLQQQNKSFQFPTLAQLGQPRGPVDVTTLNYPAIDESMIEFERNAKVRTQRNASAPSIIYVNELFAGLLMTLLDQGRNLTNFGFYVGQPNFIQSAAELRKDQFKFGFGLNIIKQNPNGNGKIS